MSVLTGSRHPHSPRPVEVHVGQLVAEKKKGISSIKLNHGQNTNDLPDPLDGVHREPQAVQTVGDQDVVGGGDRALAHVLRDQEEVVPLPPGHGVVQHGARRGVVQLLPHPERRELRVRKGKVRVKTFLLVEDPGVDPLLDHQEAEARLVVLVDVLEAVLELPGLVGG